MKWPTRHTIKTRWVLALCVLSAALLAISAQPARTNDKGNQAMTSNADNLEKATFAGGCFWCVESDFEKIRGVKEAVSGYTGGKEKDPTYEQVSSGSTGHLEAVQVVFDPAVVTYGELLDVFWRHVDPTDRGGQFVDRGSQYATAIFYHDQAQKRAAEKSKQALEDSGRFDKPVVTPIRALEEFYPAEDYHQDYYQTHKVRYKFYRWNSGRDQFLEKAWKDAPQGKGNGKYSRPADEALKKSLTPLQYDVTQKEGTEPPFRNEYWDNKQAGIYVDVVSGEPLFSSRDKYRSGTGWPSFTRPLEAENIVEKVDRKLFTTRTEVRSRHGDSHLGHVFDDGPAPTGLRYCINSAALRFVPVADLDKEGYGQYADGFGADK